MNEGAREEIEKAARELKKSYRDLVKMRESMKGGDDFLGVGAMLDAMIGDVQALVQQTGIGTCDSPEAYRRTTSESNTINRVDSGKYVDWAKELEENIEVVEKTFRCCELSVRKVSCHVEESLDCGPTLLVMVEMNNRDRNPVSRDLVLKLNLYNADGDLLGLQGISIDSASFQGSGTYTFRFADCWRLEVIIKGRLYVTR